MTPFYAIYTIKPNPKFPSGWSQVMNDSSAAAKALRKYGKVGNIWHTFDIVEIQRLSGLPRQDLARVLSRWEGLVNFFFLFRIP